MIIYGSLLNSTFPKQLYVALFVIRKLIGPFLNLFLKKDKTVSRLVKAVLLFNLISHCFIFSPHPAFNLYFWLPKWGIWLQHISILWPSSNLPPSLWTPPTLTSSSCVSANRECARCWNKLNCGGGTGGGRERRECHSHIPCAGSPDTSSFPCALACAPSASLQ